MLQSKVQKNTGIKKDLDNLEQAMCMQLGRQAKLNAEIMQVKESGHLTQRFKTDGKGVVQVVGQTKTGHNSYGAGSFKQTLIQSVQQMSRDILNQNHEEKNEELKSIFSEYS